MRESLRRSLQHSPDKQFEQYPKGSIVLCNACALPVFKLDRAIAFGDKGGQVASAFKPFAMADLVTLSERLDVDPGVRAKVRSMTLEQRTELLSKLREVRAGDPMACPVCGDCFVQVRSVDKTELLDRAFTLELLTVPPEGVGRPAPVSGREIGATKDWVH